jgi:hypothetical protein
VNEKVLEHCPFALTVQPLKQLLADAGCTGTATSTAAMSAVLETIAASRFGAKVNKTFSARQIWVGVMRRPYVG